MFNIDFRNKLISYYIGKVDFVIGVKLYEYVNVGCVNVKGVEIVVYIFFNEYWNVDLSYIY